MNVVLVGGLSWYGGAVLVGKEDLGEEDADKSATGGADDHPLSRSNVSQRTASPTLM